MCELEYNRVFYTKIFKNSFDMYCEGCYYYFTKGAIDRRLARFMN